MSLDPFTLLVINVANLLAMAITLPVIMGRDLSPAARDARRSLLCNGAAWVALIVSGVWRGQWPDWVLSSISMAFISATQWLAFGALEGWLGPRRFRRTLAAACLLMPLGYALSFPSYPVRVGWSNLLIALQLLIVARAALHPSPEATVSGRHGRWRYFLCGSLVVMAALTAIRGVLGAWFTELYPFFRAPTPFNVAALVCANVTLVLSNVAVLVAWREEAEQRLGTLVVTDPLTALLNRAGWDDMAARLVRQAHRHHLPLALVMLDLDHFKRVNDTHGHEAGDRALQLFGRLLKECQRGGDLMARRGGEEFCALLSLSDANAACGFDRRLRALLYQRAPAELHFPLDFSSGLAVLHPGETLEALMARADAALYQAKREGRGRLAMADAMPSPGAPDPGQRLRSTTTPGYAP